ncbi:MAG TPA: glycosyltransferase family 4 protein [Noviherbaspirillum sp.]|nr:glycosyltransferase family 4 protein [Noviherbaspirillum sp.]
MIRVLFIHQNLPGQFRRLIQHLQRQPGYELTGIGEEKAIARERFAAPFRAIPYAPPAGAGDKTHHYLKHFEACIRRGQAVVRQCLALKEKGYRPDVIICHPGWGEGLFLKDVFPQAKLVMFCEFYWSADGLDVGFDPEYPATLDDRLRIRIKNSVLLHSLLAADAGVTPTAWQHSVHPAEFRPKIRVVHEGIDTRQLVPDAQAAFTLDDGTVLDRRRPVLTYVARNLEPYRGFHVFMRALPRMLSANKDLRVVVVGGDEVSYGKAAPREFGSYRKALMAELGDRVDWSRVHFLGKVPYATYVRILQVSSLHVYLTYPFVLSWSMLEAMATGVPVLGSATPPVQEVIRDGENGFLCDFFDVEGLASRALELIARREEIAAVGLRGRESVLRNYDFETVGLPVYLDLLRPLT